MNSNNKGSRRVGLLVGLVAIVTAGCGSDSDSGSAPTTADSPAVTAEPAPTTAATTAAPTTAATTASTDDTTAETSDDTTADTDASTDGTTISGGTADPETFEVDLDICNDPDRPAEPVTGTWKVGFSLPLSGPVAGPVALYLEGYKPRIDKFNSENEIPGLQIEVVYKDDQFTPDKAKANAIEFIQNENVNSLTTFGSGPTGAMADDQNAECVPLLYPSSAVQEFRNIEEFPWTVQFLPSNQAEARYDISLIQSRFPDGATVGIAEGTTASGQGYSSAFQEAAAGTNIEVAIVVPMTDPNAAATQIKDANVDVLYTAGVTQECGPMVSALERVGFTPKMVVNPSNCADANAYIEAGAAADGNVIPTYIKDPSSAAYADDPAVLEYLEYVTTDNKTNSIAVAGWNTADLLINTLKQASASDDGLSQVTVIQAARNQLYAPPMYIDGIEWESHPDDLVGTNGFQTIVWSAADKAFIPEGDVIDIASS